MSDEKKEPHVCPICGGRGWVYEGFYNPPPPNVVVPSTTAGPLKATCKACGGIGVIIS